MLRKLRNLYGTYPVRFAVMTITAAFLIIFSVDMFILNRGAVWGSATDWSCQHYAIPEYLRMRFYETHELFPDFVMQLGAGQNIYNLAYYGIMNPLYLPSYFMPWMTMAVYVQVMSIVVMLVSAVMAYFFFRKHFSGGIPLVLAIMFICAGPIVFHSHRHIMFVNYYPFLMGLLFAARGSGSVKNLLIMGVLSFAVVCTSFYFSIGIFASVLIYMIYYAIESSRDSSILSIWRYIRKKLLFMILGCMAAAVLWLPVLAALYSGRASGSSDVSLIELLLPSMEFRLFLYAPNSAGVTCITAAAVFAIIGRGRGAERFLAIVLLACMELPIVTYLLNGGMYIDGKVMIPMIPLMLILSGKFFVYYMSGKVQGRITSAVLAGAAVIALIEGISYKTQIVLLIADVLLTILVLARGRKTGMRRIILYSSAAVSLVSGIVVCSWDKLAKRSDVEDFYSRDAQLLIDEKLDGTDDVFRFAEDSHLLTNVNRVYRTDYMTTNIYSSLSNSDFRNFRLHTSGSDVNTRNNAIQLQPKNVIFNSLMGCRYRLTLEESAMFGEVRNSSSGKYYLYENVYALPLGYASSDVMTESEFAAIPWEQQHEALLSNIIIPHNSGNGIVPHKSEPLHLDIGSLDKTGISVEDGVITVNSKTPVICGLELDAPLENKLILIKCTADNRVGKLKKQNDIMLTVNGVQNKLTAPTWKYHNGNYNFTYVLSSDKATDRLELVFSEGNYIISDFEAYVLDGSVLEDAMLNKDEFRVDYSRVRGDTLSGKITVSDDGWFNISIPYDGNFRITVDGSKTEYFRTNTAFVGFPIAAGEHEITVTYEAPLKKTGIIVGTISAVSAMVLLVCIYIRERKRSNMGC